MVQITEALAALSQDKVKLYYAIDQQLANTPLLIFHGASTTANSTQNSSRIQIHVFSAAGFQSFPRITVSPTSPLYAVVDYLPRDHQGDEVYRGLAFGLLKYFKELPDFVKSTLSAQVANTKGKRPGSSPSLFGEQHAADLAASMIHAENIQEVLSSLNSALSPHHLNHLDIDLVLPPNSITPFSNPDEAIEDDAEDDDFLDPTLRQYGSYAPLVKQFGEAAFLPTSKLRRAPSKPSALNRSKSFLRDQKMSLRREMGELVDTEERYVIKLDELVNQMADDYRAKAKSKALGSFSPSAEELERLFPKSLDKILQVNSAFLVDIRKVMDETEEDAMQDLESNVGSVTGTRNAASGRPKDPTGARSFANVLLEWFPKFSDCYQDYIRASQDFPKIISGFLNQQSSFSQRVQQSGEQKLRSAVIEPVQRLPRYSLFIDNIINCLPMTHPALQPMLKARDIITGICSLDPPATDRSTVVNRLKRIIEMWPPSLQPTGRLISAVDCVELPPPYQPSNSTTSRGGILLLFADCIIVLEKTRECTLSARGVLAEVDKPSAATMMASVTAAAGGQKQVYELIFMGWHHLVEVKFTESHDGRVLWMGSSKDLRDSTMARDKRLFSASMRAFLLSGAYDGKASRWAEEVVKARIEGRFSEKERESDKWALRNINQKSGGLNFYAAIFEEGLDTLVEGRKEPAPLRVVVDHGKGTKGAPIGHYGVEIVANVLVVNDARGVSYRLEIAGLNDRVYVDEVDNATFMPAFTKRVGDLLNAHWSTINPAVTTMLIAFHSKILKSLLVQLEGEKSRSFRPPSPVKLLSSFLGGGSMSSGATTPRQRSGLGSIPLMPPLSRAGSQREPQVEKDYFSQVRLHVDDTRPTNPHDRLEETLSGYIAALQSRKGNIIGASLRNRSSVDELEINGAYNIFNEAPFDPRIAEMSADVIFASLEKFIRLTWKEEMGAIMTLQTLESLQDKSAKLFPGDFADYVTQLFGEIAPQNRRAFTALIKLLIDLLDGCGNDGDRGALTVAFAELLITEGNPHNYLNLMDRLVEDGDRLFGDSLSNGPSLVGTPLNGSVNSMTRSHRSVNTGSLTSNASSLRKRFGLDSIFRQNSKNEADRPSVLRTLSKQNRQAAIAELKSSSLSKASVNGARSFDTHDRVSSPTRPVTRDRPTILGAFDERPTSSHTLLDHPDPQASPVGSLRLVTSPKKKKKRRSSLSDLSTMMDNTKLDDDLQLPPKFASPKQEPPKSPKRSSIPVAPPRTPSPTKLPLGRAPVSKLMSPMHVPKENTPLTIRTANNVPEKPTRPTDGLAAKENPTPPLRRGHSKSMSVSGIPTLRGTPRSPAGAQRPSTAAQKSPQRLKLQSPQKLRERLQRESKAINESEAAFQTELSRIGEEMARFTAASSRGNPSDTQRLAEKVKALESKIPVLIRELSSKNEATQKELETSLQAAEQKAQGYKRLHEEVCAENELLYEKFNSELTKIVDAIRGKGLSGKEELTLKLKEYNEEAAKTKKENARLRREVLTLRTFLKNND